MPKTREQCQEIKDERRVHILKAALGLFSIRGYDAVTINDIVRVCNCSHGLFYHYFKSKEAVFHAIILESSIVGKRSYPKELLLIDDAVQAIIQFVDQTIYFLEKDKINCYYSYLFLNLPYQKTLPKMHPNKDKKHLPELLEEIVIKGQKQHTFIEADPHELVTLFLSLLRGLFYKRLQEDDLSFTCPDRRLLLRVLLKDDVIKEVCPE